MIKLALGILAVTLIVVGLDQDSVWSGVFGGLIIGIQIGNMKV